MSWILRSTLRIVPFSDRFVLAAFALAGVISVSLASAGSPAPGHHLAVVFPPWVETGDAVARAAMAGARLIGTGRYPFVVIVAPEADDYSRRARDAGAVATLDADALGGCLVQVPGATS